MTADLRVMTFNVRGTVHDDGDNCWANRRDLNVATIRAAAPDLFGLQEAQAGNLSTYMDELPEYSVALGPPSVKNATTYERVPIYWHRGRLRALEGGGFYLSETPDRWSVGWGAKYPRAAVWARLRRTADGSTFVVLNTHFPHLRSADQTRVHCARLLLSKLAAFAEDDPVIVMGDFNARPGEAPYAVLAASDLTDTFTAAGHNEGVNTFHQFQGEDFPHKGVRIDWIWTQGFAVRGCHIITDATPPVYPSDHYPVVADLTLPLV
ncbi:MAG: endonuclease/exonuclease/phosphatase family protein [Chloroflexota bacterium]